MFFQLSLKCTECDTNLGKRKKSLHQPVSQKLVCSQKVVDPVGEASRCNGQAVIENGISVPQKQKNGKLNYSVGVSNATDSFAHQCLETERLEPSPDESMTHEQYGQYLKQRNGISSVRIF